MTALLFLFYLILPPHATTICALWLSQPANGYNLIEACPQGIKLEMYQVEFVSIWSDRVECIANGTAIYNPTAACKLPGKLSDYKMRIVEPMAGEEVMCAITTYNRPPSRHEIAAACSWDAVNKYDMGEVILRNMGQAQQPAPAPVVTIPEPMTGAGLYDQPTNAADLATSEPLTWLAGRLIWYGQVKPDCLGLSGLDPVTLAANACGMEATAGKVGEWQNQFDADIYAAASAEGVPARLLKRVLKVESQFWPLWDERPAGEIGMAQVTLAGADQYLRWYDPYYNTASLKNQHGMQAAFLVSLRCDNCSLYEATAKERANIVTYARILKSYRFTADDWRGALVRWNGESYAQKVVE